MASSVSSDSIQQIATRECAECLDGRDVVCRRVDHAGLWLCAMHYAKAMEWQMAIDVAEADGGSLFFFGVVA